MTDNTFFMLILFGWGAATGAALVGIVYSGEVERLENLLFHALDSAVLDKEEL